MKVERRRARRAIFLLQVFIVAALAAYIAKDFDIYDFIYALRALDPADLVPIVIFEVLYYFSNALAFWFLSRKRFGLSFSEAYGASMMSWLVDILLPSAFIEGDLARIFFLKTKSDWASAISYALFFRLLISSTLVFFVAFSSLLALNMLYLYSSVALFYALTIPLGVLLSAAMWVVVFKPMILRSWIVRASARFLRGEALKKFERDLGEFLAKVQDSARDFNPSNPHLLAALAALMLQWISGIFTPYFSLRAAGVEINPILIAPGYTVLTVFSLASVGVPFMLGSVDSALVTLYLLLRVPKERALLATLVGRGITVITTLALIYPVGVVYIKRTFSTSNLEEVRATLRRISTEYGVRIPLVG
ncbi:MAG: lysylphosphatidylglycerol synthase transmembrane domain-containing protein [Thermofilum sp.]